MTGDRVKRHHTVQAAYLRGFAEKNRLRRSPLVGSPATVSVSKATVVQNFYSTVDPDGSLDDSYERYLGAEFEGPFSRALVDLLSERPGSVPDHIRSPIARWVALQLLRTPTFRSFPSDLQDMFLRRRLSITSSEALGEYLRGRGRPTDDLDLETLFWQYRNQRGRTTGGDAAAHRALIESQHEAISDIVRARGWTLVDCAPHGLVTTDSPVVIRLPRSEKARRDDLGAGEILVTLDRHVALVAEEESGRDRWVRGDGVVAHRINGEVMMSAREAIYHHPQDDPLARLSLLMPKPYRNEALETWLDAVVDSPVGPERQSTEPVAPTILPTDLEGLWEVLERGLDEIQGVFDDLAEHDRRQREMNLPIWPSID